MSKPKPQPQAILTTKDEESAKKNYIDLSMQPQEQGIDLEFQTVIVKFQEIIGPLKQAIIDPGPAQVVDAMLSDGWAIDETIVCPPFAMITFSRESMATEETETEEPKQ